MDVPFEKPGEGPYQVIKRKKDIRQRDSIPIVRVSSKHIQTESKTVYRFVLFSIYPHLLRHWAVEQKVCQDYTFCHYTPDTQASAMCHQFTPVNGLALTQELCHIVQPEQPEPGVICTVGTKE